MDRTRFLRNASLDASSRAKSPQLQLRVCPAQLPDENPDGGRALPSRKAGSVSRIPACIASPGGRCRRLRCDLPLRYFFQGPRWRGRRTSLPTPLTRFPVKIADSADVVHQPRPTRTAEVLLAEPSNNNKTAVRGQFQQPQTGAELLGTFHSLHNRQAFSIIQTILSSPSRDNLPSPHPCRTS